LHAHRAISYVSLKSSLSLYYNNTPSCLIGDFQFSSISAVTLLVAFGFKDASVTPKVVSVSVCSLFAVCLHVAIGRL